MKINLLILLFLFNSILITKAQFVENGEIEFEVKTNLKKTLGNDVWSENMKDKLPNFKTAFYKYQFSKNTSKYQFDHWENKESVPEMFRQSDEKSIWFLDLNKGSYIIQKDVFGSTFSIKDSLKNIRWKLTNENRIIAGYNCRKAVGKIMDSIYVFAFYTEEITIPGGPCTIHGLPGMVLGMTIPRLYSSWIATKVKIIKEEIVIIEPTDSKNIFTEQEALNTVKEKMKGWGDSNDDSGRWINQLIWNLLL